MISLNITSASRVGRVRHKNEDMILVNSHFVRDDYYQTQVTLNHEDRFLMAVADGMGGHNRGDVASSDALHSLQFYFYDIPARLDAGGVNEAMVGWLDSINNFIASKGRADEQYKDMGTTLVGLAYYFGSFYSMNCGDSRMYRLRDIEFTQLTSDHSLSNMMGSERHTSVITNCIGGGCGTSYLDLVQISDVQSGDIFLLCSDGLTDMLSDPIISSMLTAGADADALCNAAIDAGGLDNVSCCVITIK